ncbi:unnamed protein product [Soboliphyme baturini]|uniref:Cleavage and polyadenylation specificity factor subunit 2 n=1 Tax=Soboliphyme baturini TaxID=241478 RepID=A0A183INK1_9BILA|nr:unnamed protein product [Soboliphyme baturini]
MTSIIKLEVISGAYDDLPVCYLLQVDEFHFLLDCGWDETFDMHIIETLQKRIQQIDAVLLSFADIPHLGALPYLVGKCNLNCPIYATVPVYKMGQMFMYDWYQSHQNVEDFEVFSLDDVDVAFDKVQQLKYSQNVSLKGRGHGLQITPLPAGHMIGGTIWRITKMGEEEIVYAIDFNHKKERHLNGCSFESIVRPNLLIFDAFNAYYLQARRKQRDEALLTNILQTVRNGGNVLLVIDTAGRVLELAQLLDQLWHNAEAGLIAYNLVLLNNVAYNVIEFAKSQVEWMSDKILRSFEEGRYNPFQFRHVQLCHSLAELARIHSPKVVLTSHPDMECGFSRELFLEWCVDPKNSIIVTSRPQSNTLASRLIALATTKDIVPNRQVTLEIKRRVRLEGAELDEYWRVKKEKEQQAARQRLEAQRRSNRIETVESSEDSNDEEVGVEDAAEYTYDVMFRFEQQQKASFFKHAKKTYPLLPFVEEKIKWDDYGEIIHPEDYMIVDTALPMADIKRERDPFEGDTAPQASPEMGVVEVPTKCIRYVQKLEVLCKIAYIDFEGRSDGESVKKILQQIKPKQLVIVHALPEATRHLADYCRNTLSLVQGKVFTPRVGEVIDATIESHIYQVTLTDVLMSSLELQPLKDAELAWVDARVVINKQLSDLDDVKSDTGSKRNQLAGHRSIKDEEDFDRDSRLETPTLDFLPFTSIPAHTSVFVNDPKLSDLKQLLMLNGFLAEFFAGVLYVNNVVAIKRNEIGKLNIEGFACDDFYKIRDIVYKQYAIV